MKYPQRNYALRLTISRAVVLQHDPSSPLKEWTSNTPPVVVHVTSGVKPTRKPRRSRLVPATVPEFTNFKECARSGQGVTGYNIVEDGKVNARYERRERRRYIHLVRRHSQWVLL